MIRNAPPRPRGSRASARAALLVAERELRVRLRSRAYRVATLAAPLVLAAMVFVPALLRELEEDEVRRIVVLDATAEVAPELERRLTATGRYAVVPAPSGGGEQALRRELGRAEIDGYLVIPRDAESGAGITYHGRGAEDPVETRLLQGLVSEALAQRRMAEAGIDPGRVAELNRAVPLRAYAAAGETAVDEDRTLVAHVFIFALYFMILTYGIAITTSVTDEKASRSVELLLSSVRPFDLMTGKLLGVGTAALLQYLIWAASALLFVKVSPVFGSFGGLPGAGPGVWLAFLFFFVAGFLLFGTLYLALGALAPSQVEAQQMHLPATLTVLVAFLLAFYVADRPDAPPAVALSLLPPFTPMLLFARMVVSQVPAWQVGLGVALLLGAIAVGTAGAAKIYRVAILLHGRRAGLREVLVWLRRA